MSATYEQVRDRCVEAQAKLDSASRVLADHDHKYFNHPPGRGSNMALLMLCEDTIAEIRVALGLT